MSAQTSTNPARAFFAGVALVFRGFALWGSAPGIMLLGLIPAVVVFVLFAILLVLLAGLLPGFAEWATLWAQNWDPGWRGLLRVLIVLAVAGGGAVLLALSYTAVVLAVGAPFYDRIAERVDARLGTRDTASAGFRGPLVRGIRDAIVLILIAAAGGIVLFAIGLVPVIGGIAGAVLGALFGAWLLTLELTGVASERRGLSLGDRSRLLTRGRATTLGFGLTVFLLLLVPLLPLVVMPSAVAGGTLLVRRLRGEPLAPVRSGADPSEPGGPPTRSSTPA